MESRVNGNGTLLTVTEAAKYLGISAVWLRVLTETGKIRCTRVPRGGNAWRYYSLDDLDALKAARAARGRA